MQPLVIRLSPNDAERFAQVRRQMLLDAPWAFAATPEDDVALDIARLRELLGQDQNEILAIQARDLQWVTESGSSENDTSELAAVAGVRRNKNPKFAHRARLWGVFVDPRFRGHGLGRLVTAAAVEFVAGWKGVEFIDLGVSENSLAAQRLYESLGFKEWGREPETTQHNGQRYDEIFMTLRVRPCSSS